MTSVAARPTTPARRLDLPTVAGCVVLGAGPSVAAGRSDEPGSEFARAAVAVATDRTALSDELHLAAHTDGERVHLDRGRANVLRALDLPRSAAVLEVGARCGALTRHLGETVALVDAVEADPRDAAAAAARTADLDTVTVFVGDVAGLPDEAAYDVAVAVGPRPDVDVLRALHRRLRAGGVLVLATDNPAGVSSLVDPEVAPPAAALGLDRVLRDAGYARRTVLGVFPDHTVTRAVLGPSAAAELPGPAVALAGLDGRRREAWTRLVAEAVEPGDATRHADGVVVLAARDDDAVELWPADRLATYFNTDRAARLCARGDMTRTAGPHGAVVSRAPLAGDGDAGRVRLCPHTEPVHVGPTLLDEMVARPDDAVELLTHWRELVESQWDRLGVRCWDLVPHNVIVTPGGLLPIDLEWEVDDITVDVVLGRGLLLTADRLATRGWRGAGTDTTVWELAGWLGVACGVELAAVDRAVETEAWFQAVRVLGHSDDPALPFEIENMRRALTARLQHRVEVSDARR